MTAAHWLFLSLPLLCLVPTTDQVPSSQAKQVQPKPIALWPDGAPGALGKEPADIPELTVYLPPADKATGAAIVICPGGGYGGLAMSHEGHDVARWLNSIGVAGIILKYRHAQRIAIRPRCRTLSERFAMCGPRRRNGASTRTRSAFSDFRQAVIWLRRPRPTSTPATRTPKMRLAV